MRKRLFVSLVFYLLFLGLVSNIVDSLAWGNGFIFTGYYKKGLEDRGTVTDLIERFKQDYNQKHIDWNTAQHYGTHHWIAECALEVLFLTYPLDPFIKDIKLNNRDMKIYFLLGAEMMDFRRDHERGKDFEIDTGQHVITKRDILTASHALRLNSNGEIIEDNYYGLYIHVQKYDKAISKMFEEKDCKAAAFFLGVICHAFGDATYFPHLIDCEGSSYASVKSNVKGLTRRKYADWITLPGGAFFNDTAAQLEFGKNKPAIEDPLVVLKLAAWDTLKGKALSNPLAGFQGETYKDMVWMDKKDVPIGEEGGDWANNEWAEWRQSEWTKLASLGD